MKRARNIILTLYLSIGLSSCLYQTSYLAKYDIKNSSNSGQSKIEIREQINRLSIEHQLQKDNKFIGTDTLGFFGSPYHYFKFWTSNNDSIMTLNLKYNGNFGSKKNPPYGNLLSQLTDSLNQIFNVTNIEIIEESNRKKK